MKKFDFYLGQFTKFTIIAVWVVLVIALFACKKSSVVPSGPVVTISSPTSHQIKYVLFADPHQQIKGSYLDSAGRTIAFDSWNKKLDTIAIHPVIIDLNGWHGMPGCNFQIKIGTVDNEHGTYIKVSGAAPQGSDFALAICKDTILLGETHYVVKQIAYRYPSANGLELSYIVR